CRSFSVAARHAWRRGTSRRFSAASRGPGNSNRLRSRPLTRTVSSRRRTGRSMPESAADLLVANVCKSYPTADGELVILAGGNLSLAPGHALAIMGPSGAGKSTLLYIIGTLEAPTSGSVALLGRNPFTLDRPRLAQF